MTQNHTTQMSKISPTYPWKIPLTLHQQFLKEFLSLWGFGEFWGTFPGYVGKIIENGGKFHSFEALQTRLGERESCVVGRKKHTHHIGGGNVRGSLLNILPYTSRSLTAKATGPQKETIVLQPSFFRGYVKLRGCNHWFNGKLPSRKQKTNMAIAGKSAFLIGDTSSFMVVFLSSS